MGFLSENRIYPDDGAALVVTVNADFGTAKDVIANQLEDMILGVTEPSQEPKVTPREPIEDPATIRLVASVLDQLAEGRLNQELFTLQAAAYFTPEVRMDLESSLQALGRPEEVRMLRRGPWSGYDGSIHEVVWPTQKLILVVFRTEDGLIEDFTLFSPN